MSARPIDELAPQPALRPMQDEDLDAVFAIEINAYPFPWTLGIFRDCLHADYPAWVMHVNERIVGYFLMSVAAGEAHLLNLCIARQKQGLGYGRKLLLAMLHVARGRGAKRVFLEVRPSNRSAIALYHAQGFNEIGRRPRYYPARDGREDALVMAFELLPPE